MNNFLHGPQNIYTFINFHNKYHVNYCETIIYPNGTVEYCIPSHQETLIRACNMDKEDVCKRISIWDDIMIALCNISNCVAVWYNAYINPNKLTNEQYESLKLLRNNKCINPLLLLTKESGYQSIRSD